MRLSVYALGGGMGHLTRALAFSRVAQRSGHEVRVLANSSKAESLLSAARKDRTRGWTSAANAVEVLPPGLTPEQTHKHVLAWLNESWDALLVDTFPRGLGGELAEFVRNEKRPVFLVHRDLNERYVESRNLAVFASTFKKVFLPGESGPLADLPNATKTSPWLICDPQDVLDRRTARDAIRSSDLSRPLILVVGSGRPEEVIEASNIARRLTNGRIGDVADVRFASLKVPDDIDPATHVSAWPLMRYLRAVDLLIGAGGYNTVNEARATKTRLLAIPRQRMYDRQDRRLTNAERFGTVDGLIAAVNNWVSEAVLKEEPTEQLPFVSGVHAAIRQIEFALNIT